jgi:hypothetical protein
MEQVHESAAASAAWFNAAFHALISWSSVNIKRLDGSNFPVRALKPLAGLSGISHALDC